MLCRHCGVANPEERQFCRQCAASLHWQAVVGPAANSGRHGLIGLVTGALVLLVGLLIFQWPFAAPSGATSEDRASQAVPTAEALTATATSVLATVTATGELSAPPQGSQPGATPASTLAPLNAAQTGADAQAAAVYLNAAGLLLLQNRASFASFSDDWRAEDGYAARLAAGLDSHDAVPVAQGIEQVQGQIAPALARLAEMPAPSALQALHEAIIGALTSANEALDRAMAVTEAPSAEAIDEASVLLDGAAEEFARAAAELESASVRRSSR